ncbi:MAG: DUF4340 domain-containing protein [Nitrospirae bacterium]|nr:DUF4340 domain-containing protein [Nitrospirota bacterium]
MKKIYLLLAGAIVILGATAFFVQDPMGLFEKETSGRVEILKSVDTKLWSSLQIKSPSGTTELVREAEGWKVKTVRNYKAEETAVKNLLDQLGQLKEGEVASRNKSKHDVFEVSEVKGTEIKGGGPKGEGALDIIIGKTDPGGRTFLRVSGKDEVYRVSAPIRSTLRSAPSDWLDKKLFSFTQNEIDRLSLSWEGKATALQRMDDSHWQILEPHKAPADADVLNGIASNLVNFSFTDFEPEGTTLTAPVGMVEITLKDGRKRKAIFSREKDQSHYRGQVDDGANVFKISEGVVLGLRKPIDELYEKRLLRNSPDDITEFTLEHKQTLTAKKKDNGDWELVAPEKADAKKEVAQEVCSTIANLKADQAIYDEAKKGYGFKDRRLKSTFVLKDGSRKEFLWGSKAKDGKIHVTLGGSPLVYLVPETNLTTLSQAPSDLKK